MHRILIIFFIELLLGIKFSRYFDSLNPSNTTYQTVEGFGGGIKGERKIL